MTADALYHDKSLPTYRIRLEFVSANILERLKHAKLVFLSGAFALSDRECETL